jgi:hypothetical protein
MLESILQRTTVVITESHVHAVKASAWPKQSAHIVATRPVVIRADNSQGLAEVLKDLLLEALPKRGAVRVLLADELVRYWVAQAPSSANRLSDIEAAAAMRFQQLFDERIADWHMAVSVEAGQPCLASAVHRTLCDQVLVATRQQGLTLTDMQPELVAVWNKWRTSLKPGQWLGVWRGRSLILVITEGKGLSALRQIAVPAQAHLDADWLQQHIQREAMRLNVALPQQIRLCGQAPHHWLSFNASPVPCDTLGKPCDALSLLGAQA